jgi:CheY-like chemotaxis protein
MRILYVEDDPSLRELMKEIMVRMGFETEIVNNGFEALVALENRYYDIVLMDLSMPVMNGLEAARFIGAKSTFVLKPKIIIMSGHKLEKEQYAELGIHGFIQKPFSLSELRQSILDLETGFNNEGHVRLCIA